VSTQLFFVAKRQKEVSLGSRLTGGISTFHFHKVSCYGVAGSFQLFPLAMSLIVGPATS